MAGYKTPELKDDDVIHAAWVDDDNDYQGYWLNNITRMVEESDEQYEKNTKGKDFCS
jgi:hypothetical protein